MPGAVASNCVCCRLASQSMIAETSRPGNLRRPGYWRRRQRRTWRRALGGNRGRAMRPAGMGNRQIVNDAISMMSWNRMWRKALQRLTIASSFHPSRVVAPVSCAHRKQARADSFPLPGRALFGEALRNQSVAVHPNASRVSPVGVGVGSHPSACPSISRQAWQSLCVS